jgi:hypothetical protein
MDEATMERRLKQLDDVTAVAVLPGNLTDGYMVGMANGLLLAQATMQGTDPVYIKISGEGQAPANPPTFEQAIAEAVNCHSRENGSNTPDFMLASFLANCLTAFDGAVRTREAWYGRDPDRGPGLADAPASPAASPTQVA